MSVEAHAGVIRARRRAADGPFFLFMAVLLLVVAVVGFGPNSVAILAGERPFPPTLIHVHAALMLSWLLLLITQTSLRRTGNMRLHRQLGTTAFLLLPVMLVVMIVASYARLEAAADAGPIEPIRFNILLLQLRAILLFPFFVVWALVARRNSQGAHKRLMIVATVVLLDAALARTGWLPGPEARHSSYESMSIFQLLLLTPLVVHDLRTTQRPHFATISGVGVFALSAIVVNLLWGSEWWLTAAAGMAERAF